MKIYLIDIAKNTSGYLNCVNHDLPFIKTSINNMNTTNVTQLPIILKPFLNRTEVTRGDVNVKMKIAIVQ